jgi:hypothetical protein
MGKSKVVDMFSRKDMADHGQDTEANDAVARSQGRFIGTLSKETAERLTSQMSTLNGRNEQISAMSEQWQQDFVDHVTDLQRELVAIGMKPEDFDPERQDIAVGKDGKVWVLDSPKDGPLQ